VLAADWASAEGGAAFAFIVDHGLRAGSAAEAAETAAKLGCLGIVARILTLTDLISGAGMPARARAARLAALEAACQEAGLIDLLLAHHAADQAETIIMRQLRGSGPAGLAGMASVSETTAVRLLRPLLGIPPGRLRTTLVARGLDWAEDPTNADAHYTRARLRAARSDAAGTGASTRALAAAAAADGAARREAEATFATWIAGAVTIRPEGFAILPVGSWPPAALAALLAMVAGAAYPPSSKAVAAIAAAPQATIGGGICIGGARLRPAGRLGPGFLLCREAAAMAPPVPATAGAVWDGRFRRPAHLATLAGETIGAVGANARSLRGISDLPSAVLETLPAHRLPDGNLVAVPAVSWPDPGATLARSLLFHPLRPALGALFGAL
jgi:tRNA(Ile)-lysidine synthase